jgi:hypothetical protein
MKTVRAPESILNDPNNYQDTFLLSTNFGTLEN